MSSSTQCLDCRHYTGLATCDAFPDKIPQEIINGTIDHTKPYPGDGGITFEVLDGELTPVQIEQVVAKLSERGLLKGEDGTRMEWRTVTRDGKTFRQRFKVGQKQPEKGREIVIRDMEDKFITISEEVEDDIRTLDLNDIAQGVNLDELELNHLESINDGLNRSIGKYNIRINYVGWDLKKNKVFAIYSEFGGGKHSSIGFRKTPAKNPKGNSAKNLKGYRSDKPLRMDKLKADYDEYPYSREKIAYRMKKLEKCERWLVSDDCDDPLAFITTHEGFHCIYHQKGLESVWTDNLKKYVGEKMNEDIKCTSVSEYGCSSISELFAEVGAAVSFNILIDKDVKQAYLDTMESIK